MFLTGIADEAARGIDGQLRAIAQLGWANVELRNIEGQNLTAVDDAVFEKVQAALESSTIKCNCFSSTIGNWARKITDSPENSYEELRRAIPRMHKLGTQLIRVMSFQVPVEDALDENLAQEVFRRMDMLVKIAEDGGVTLVHENCNNWGGRSYEHTLRLLDRIQSPAFKLVYDTGNPVFSLDVRGAKPYKYQSSLEFFRQVRERVIYVHIKDGKMIDDKMRYMWPGDGDGDVREVVTELLAAGYDGGFSMEPHMSVVYHEQTSRPKDETERYATFVEYGQRFEKLLGECHGAR